jgi:uncharacterized membrane protein YkgB
LTQWVASYFYRSMGRETWTLWGCLALLDWWWPWILWISSGTSLHCFMLTFPFLSLLPDNQHRNLHQSLRRTWVLPQSGCSTMVIVFRFVGS